MVMTAGTRGIGLVMTFLLAAILGPADFGLVAVGLIYVTFIRMLMEQGFGTALIQRENLEDEHLDSAFWLNFAWSIALMGLSFASAGWWAHVNDMPRLERVIQVLSLMIFFEGLGVVQQALMQRQLDYKRLAIRSNLAIVLGGATGVALAVAGAGVWALVAQQLVLEFTFAVTIWVLSTWRPKLRFSRRHARELLGFSSSVFAANVAGFVSRRADALLMGIFFGPVVIGLYRFADRLVDVVLEVTMRPVGMVSLPVLSRLQNDPEALRAAVARCLRTTLLISVPVLLLVLACADEIVGVLGSKWDKSAIALEFLCLVGIGKAIGFFAGPVLFAVGRPRFRAVMLWVLAAVSTLSVLGAGRLLRNSSADHQILGMSGTRALLFLGVLVPVNLAIVSWTTGLRLRVLLPALPAPLLAGGSAVAVAFGLRQLGVSDRLPDVAALIVVGGVSALTAAVVLLTLERDLRGQLVGLARRTPRSVRFTAEAPLQAAPPSTEA